ncbi:Alpha/Beta hydrolase protein [Mrakia frigida]|uniref:alpha/beta hydrolase n=1 Tax=Mrakia frigida TaxID=29902 RepID=UPI003FCC1D56
MLAIAPPPLSDLLSAFTSPLQDGTTAEAPKGSRIDRQATQTRGKRFIFGWGISELWRAGWFVADRANHLAKELVVHTVYGPRKKSWGVEMTIITSFMRDVGKHSSLTDITFIRGLIALTSYVPLPPSALVTPVSFRVRFRNLKGILREFDEHEQGGSLYEGSGKGRELTGEWIVDKTLWAKWQREYKQSRRSRSKERNGDGEKVKGEEGIKGGDRIVLYLHGGAYYTASAASHRLITIQVAQMCEARVFAINYRLAPETRFPGPLHDAVSAYFRLIDDLKIPPENIIFAGDSAGGGLCLALLMYLRDNSYPLPSGAILMSPWVDLTMSCDSWDSNAPFDIVPRPEPNDHLNPIFCYLGEEGVKKYLTHPYASPLFGDFEGLPPLLIQSGEAEVLRDEHILLAHKATLAGVLVMHEMFEDAVHVFMTFPFLEATRVAFDSQHDFVFSVLPLHTAPTKPLAPEMTAALGSEIQTADSKVVRGDGAELSEEDEQKTRQLWEEEEERDCRNGQEGEEGEVARMQRLDTGSITTTTTRTLSNRNRRTTTPRLPISTLSEPLVHGPTVFPLSQPSPNLALPPLPPPTLPLHPLPFPRRVLPPLLV